MSFFISLILIFPIFSYSYQSHNPSHDEATRWLSERQSIVSGQSNGSIDSDILLRNVLTLNQVYLNPIPIYDNITWNGFASNVIGRVDVTNEYDGAELNTEYIFGVFAYQSTINTTRLVPVANSSNLVALAVGKSTVSYSIIANYSYGIEGMPLQPVQIDGWLKYDLDNPTQMIAYDFTFRRYAWSIKVAYPYLLKPIAKELGYRIIAGEGPNNTISLQNGRFKKKNKVLTSLQLIQKRAAMDTCEVAQKYCVGPLKQYEDLDSCVRFLTISKPLGEAFELGQDTTMCRYVHRCMVPKRPEVHCPHIGPSGGDMCISRDYATEVLNPAFIGPFLR